MYYETLDLKIDFNSSICEGILLFSLILMHDITKLAQNRHKVIAVQLRELEIDFGLL